MQVTTFLILKIVGTGDNDDDGDNIQDMDEDEDGDGIANEGSKQQLQDYTIISFCVLR